MTEPQNPTAWLWEQLFALLPPDQYNDLHAQFEAQQRRYNRAAALRTARRELATYERMRQAASSQYWQGTFDRKIANRKRRIAELEAELDNTT